MKPILYIIHIPMIIVGWILGTLWFGYFNSFQNAIEFWEDKNHFMEPTQDKDRSC